MLQRVLSSSKLSHVGKSSLKDNIAWKFSNLMMCGIVKDALYLLSDNNCGGPLPMNSSVMNALKTKHPKKRVPLHWLVIIMFLFHYPTPLPLISWILLGYFENQWCCWSLWSRCCSLAPCMHFFSDGSCNLCDALSAVARRLCATFVDPAGLSAFISCCLIALDKCPGVRPISVGKTVWHIIAKAVLSVIKEEIWEATGSSQLCAGQLSGCEVAVHSVQTLFGSPGTENAMLVDATNAFNSLNHQATLYNIQHLCPSFSTILINTYRVDVAFYIEGSTLLLEEDTTQGDPLAIPIDALGDLPLIDCISDDFMQVWYADDATACESLSELCLWWDKLLLFEPDFGYFQTLQRHVWL